MVVHRTLARIFSIGELYVCSRGLKILKLEKNSTDLQCFIIQLGDLEFCLGAKPPKVARGDGTG